MEQATLIFAVLCCAVLCCAVVCCCRGDRVERARLYKAPNEPCFGVQIATNNIAEGVKAAMLAQEAGGPGRCTQLYMPAL